MSELFLDECLGEPTVRGFFHRANKSESADALVLTHSAGGDCNSPLLVHLAEVLCDAGISVLRCDLPFRQSRAHGPPRGSAEEDQEGLGRAVQVIRDRVDRRVFLGGHSYGGRMSTMLAAREPSIVDGLLLLSYPLHPPRRPQQLRTGHFPDLRTRTLFVHGTRDPFGSINEMEAALTLISAETKLLPIEGAGHELLSKNKPESFFVLVTERFVQFFS